MLEVDDLPPASKRRCTQTPENGSDEDDIIEDENRSSSQVVEVVESEGDDDDVVQAVPSEASQLQPTVSISKGTN